MTRVLPLRARGHGVDAQPWQEDGQLDELLESITIEGDSVLVLQEDIEACGRRPPPPPSDCCRVVIPG